MNVNGGGEGMGADAWMRMQTQQREAGPDPALPDCLLFSNPRTPNKSTVSLHALIFVFSHLYTIASPVQLNVSSAQPGVIIVK
jgi:hypothetical protein